MARKPDSNNNNSSNISNNNITKKAAWGTVSTICLRLVSFICTQYTYRKMADNPAILGSTQIKFELLLTTILFISREGFRLALMSSGSSNQHLTETKQSSSKSNKNTTSTTDDEDFVIWNIVAWCTIPVSTMISMLAYIWISNNNNDVQSNNNYNDYQYGIILYCIAACIEAYGEPAVLITLRDMNVTMKASAEGMAIITKTTMLPILLSHFSTSYAMTSFGMAQIIYSFAYTIFLYWNVRKTMVYPNISLLWHLFRNRLTKEDSNGSSSLLLQKFVMYINKVFIFTLQGSLKHMLTEGDRIVLTMLSGSYDQGIYAMGSSYGSLAARLLLQPLEENARLLWSRIVSNTQSNISRHSNANPKQTDDDISVYLLLQSSYVALVKGVLYVGFVFSCLAVNYTRILLVILAGNKWGQNQQAANVLSAFCIYTAFLAWNGMTEAFVYAIIASSSSINDNNNNNDTTSHNSKSKNSNQLAKYIGQLSIAHTVVGIVFAIVASLAVQQYGTVGLVVANCIAMLVRSIYAVSFAATYFIQVLPQHTTKPPDISSMSWRIVFFTLLRDMYPKPMVILSFLVSFIITRLSLHNMEISASGQIGTRLWYQIAVRHIMIGITCSIGTITLAYYNEYEFRQSIITLWKGNKQSNKTINQKEKEKVA